MVREGFDPKAFNIESVTRKSRWDIKIEDFGPGLSYDHGVFDNFSVHSLPPFLDGINVDHDVNVNVWNHTTMEVLKNILRGYDLPDGSKALGLEELSKRKIHPEHKYANKKQQAGFAAEVISTAKENLEAKVKDTGVTTYRADDRPDLYPKNDSYVDKIRIDNKTGKVIERVQTKFVGKNAKECFSKLRSKKYDKYFEDGKVDKIEVPKEFYDDIKKMIPEKIQGLEKQLDYVKNDPDPSKAEGIRKRIDKCKKIDSMLEKSNTTSEEALFAREHPRRYVGKMMGKEAVKQGNNAGLESGAFAAGLTATISTVDNVQKFMNHELTAQEAVLDITKDTGMAGAAAYGTTFVSTAVSSVMSSSSQELIQSVAASGVPSIAISFGIDTYDSVIDFAQGNINSYELAYDLGESAIHIAGSMAGAELASNVGAVIGGTVGSVIPGAGTAAGMAVGKAAGYGVGVVGGMVGCALASEAYVTAVQAGVEGAGILAENAKASAEKAVSLVKENAPEKVNNIRKAVNEYAGKFSLPFSI